MRGLLIRKIENFDLNRAELDVEYVLCRQYKNWRGKVKIEPIYKYHIEGGRLPVTGDLAWAKRVARHYGLPAPKESV